MTDTATEKDIKTFMQSIVDEHICAGAVMCTELAEEAALHYGANVEDTLTFDWLCEIALDVAQEWEAAQAYEGV